LIATIGIGKLAKNIVGFIKENRAGHWFNDFFYFCNRIGIIFSTNNLWQ
jgi:hypothetical protein